MKIHRFFINTGFTKDTIRITDIELVHQIRDVLKLHEGESCVLFNASKQEARATISAFVGKDVEVKIERVILREDSEQKIFLYCAILKRENFELVAQKAAELGVSEIIPVITQRTIKTGLRRSRLEKIVTEASEQSGQIYIPIIHEPILFAEALHIAQDHELTVVLHTELQDQSKPIEKRPYKSMGLFIGPEGGFNEEEIKQAKEYNYYIHTFPHTVLRAETAAIVGVFWIRELLEID